MESNIVTAHWPYLCLLAFVVFGMWRIAVKRARRAASERQLQEQRERAEQAKLRREKRLQVRRESASFALGWFVVGAEEIQVEIDRRRAKTLGEFDLTAADLVVGDAVTVVRLLVLAKDRLRPEDLRCLRFLCEGAKLRGGTRVSDAVLTKWVEKTEGHGLELLSMMSRAGSDSIAELEARFIAFAKEVGNRPQRHQALAEVLTMIHSKAQGRIHGSPSPRVVLGVAETATMAEIRAAYHAKVRRWHPDQLENMAPELRAYANQELARINAAYGELTSNA